MKAKATFDPEADAMAVWFKPDDAVYDVSEEVAPGLTLDYDTQGRVIGVEILGVKRFLAERRIEANEAPDAAAKPAAAE